MTVVEFPKPKASNREAGRLAASKPRNSKNGTPEERAAKTALRKEKHRTWYRDFGHRLRVTRLALGITEAEAAAASLITLSTYRRREAGLPYRGWHEGLSSFVHKYDVSWNWMLAGSGEMRASAEEASKAEFVAAYNALTPNQQAMVTAKLDKLIQSRPPARPALVVVSDNKKPA
jgi:transcriptional regulator with XRE-family HTH domain